MSHLFHKKHTILYVYKPCKITCGLLLTTIINLSKYRSTLLVRSHPQKWVSLSLDIGFTITKVLLQVVLHVCIYIIQLFQKTITEFIPRRKTPRLLNTFER